MVRVNQKLKLSIAALVRTIAQDKFDENTVKLLLIDTRDFSGNLENLREICHFVAHPERNQGAIHRKILSRFFRVEYMNRVMEQAMANKDVHNPRPGEDFGDYVFRTIPLVHYSEFEKKYFETVFIDGLDDFEDSFFDKMLKKSKADVSRLIQSNYKKVDGRFRLRSTHDQGIVRAIFILETSVQFRPLISDENILSELRQTLLGIASDVGLTELEIDQVFLRREQLFLAILGLLHDIAFTWEGITIGRSFLFVHESKIGLMCDFHPNARGFKFYLVNTTSSVESYIENGETVSGELKKFTLCRSDGGNLVYR